MSAILLAICVLLSAAASIFLKMGASTLTGALSFSAVITNPMIWVGGVCYAAAFLGYIYVLRVVPLSLAQPTITVGVSTVTALVAVFIFREPIALINWVGLVLIFVGICLLFLGRT